MTTTKPIDRKDKWWVDRHAAKLSLRDSMKTIDLVLLGDSITHSWESEAAAKVWKSSFGDLATLNIGFSGDRTEHVLWRLQNGAVDDISPKAVMIMIGTNNTGHDLDAPEDIADGVKAIVGELRQRLPESKLLLLGVFPCNKSSESKQRINNLQVNEIIKDYADDESVFYMDIGKAFFDESGEMTKKITPDFLHLSPAGYQIWADSVKAKLDELLK